MIHLLTSEKCECVPQREETAGYFVDINGVGGENLRIGSSDREDLITPPQPLSLWRSTRCFQPRPALRLLFLRYLPNTIVNPTHC